MTIQPNSNEFFIILGFTIFIVIVKLVVALTLTKKIQDKKARDETAGLDFMKGVDGFIILLLISRILYIVFDFHYTKFNEDLYYLSPNIWFWKIGMCISALALMYIVYVVDKKILNNKY